MSTPELRIDTRTKIFVVLAATFTTCLVVGDIIGGKLIGVPMPAWTSYTTVGMIPFPVTFLLTDLLNEFYGKKAARFVTYAAFGCAILSFTILYIALAVPIADFTHGEGWDGVRDESFQNVFGGSLRMIIASLTAYLVGQLTDIMIFHRLRNATGGKMLWLRATGSTLVSQALDTVVVSLVAWVGMRSIDEILNIVLTGYSLKVLIAIGLTPVIYAGHAAIERWFGIVPLPAAQAPAPAKTGTR